MTASSAIVPAPLSLYVKLVLTAALWGGQFIAGRVVAQVLPHFTASVLRFGVAAVVLLVLVRMREGGLPRLDARFPRPPELDDLRPRPDVPLERAIPLSPWSCGCSRTADARPVPLLDAGAARSSRGIRTA